MLHRQRVKGPQASVEVAACADVAATIDVDNISSATELEDPIPPALMQHGRNTSNGGLAKWMLWS